MWKYLKESLRWLHLVFFKPITCAAAARVLREGGAKGSRIFFAVHLTMYFVAIIFCGTLAVSLAWYWAGGAFHWSKALSGAGLFGLFFGVVFIRFGLTQALIGALFGGLVGGTIVGMGAGLVAGVGAGVGCGLLFTGTSLGRGLVGGFLLGLYFAFVGGVVADSTIPPPEALRFAIGYTALFLITYLRPFHLVSYCVQLSRSRKAVDPFFFFRNSPVYWDEGIAMPLPFLTGWLVDLAKFNRDRGMSEIVTVAMLPNQRRAAQRALIEILLQDLDEVDSFQKIAAAPLLMVMPLSSDAQLLPAGLSAARWHIDRVAELASDYLTRVTAVGQLSVLDDLRKALESFRASMIVRKPRFGQAFQAMTTRWLEIVKAERAECRKRLAFEPIPNPFVVGNPLMVRDHNLFKGRKDIIVAIEENIINPAQRPALLLYGRRRIGKTSTLLNLPRLLSSKFVPVFIDCQDAKWREGDDAFCYHLATSIHNALNQRSLVETNRKPKFEPFERYAFTRLSGYLDQIEETARTAHKQILLTFDEYEKLEEGISASRVTTEVLNQLRTIVQHRERIVVLFSGGHRFEEMRTINWSDYLINVKTLELSFLAPEDARELITEPVPLLQYERGVIEQIIELTHCQPYLLQAVASDLVNYLNAERRMLATSADLEIAVEKVLVTAQAYFFYTWTGDCTEPEREVLRLIATGNANRRTLAEHQPSLQSLCHKEILERHASDYRFSVELFRRWVLKNQTTQAFPSGDLPEPAELEYADLQTTHT